ncbi:nitrogen regulation protein NR(II) [Gilvimarinus agarilyticus]|uniref:nitrogen regulation protein NR(II) n=1 Tax=unclassified Gilvimarinus TaxID=2642066 RepID=UPI001C090576|nr:MULTISPECIES: nitrogen regulation protein NR(II) [unclassified Gilvimarinus]MBU2887802.1 nitrogen regulation protein NR(II) [Gilvimarinus agarilyticus]MDO6572441.1 nitrogen regulation protein NR(II) [Gilvimarinus sp. 2_MG-2023]MDO6746585.1 nitrogen regulation protein NR(II) [Gilvimarinus sp. 1_MG-2023]
MTPTDLHKQLLDSLSTAIILLDGHLQLCHINPAAEALLSISLERCLGEPFTHFFHESSDTPGELSHAAQQANHYTKRHAEWQLLNGEQITVDYTVTPFSHNQGLVIEILPIDRLLRISREEMLSSSQETTRILIRGMAHEIKNPLGGIRGAAQLLARELPEPELKEYTGIIIDEADRLRNLVDRMLGPNQLPQLSQLNIHEVLERVATMIHAESGDAIHIVRDYDPSLPDINGDKEQLIQALLNIARNAMQAMKENHTPNPTLTLRSRVRRQYTIAGHHHPLVIHIEVVDNGPGIPEHMVKQIFYPMISGRAEGTGLGLTISQHLIHQHNGLIECHSEPGETRFSLFLPMETTSSSTTATRNRHAEV